MNAPPVPTPRSTRPGRSSSAHLDETLERFFRRAPARPGDAIVVAFSGGPDSTALLLGLTRLSAGSGSGDRPGFRRIVAAHLDHGADPGSAHRARRAVEIARSLGVPVRVERRTAAGRPRPGESLEAAARRERYAFLEEVRLAEDARWIATAHHRDDQAETVLLRMLYGSGLEGLAAMRPVRGRLIRPLLGLDRRDLAAAVREAGIEPLDDPTNRDLSLARNRIRHALLPHLEKVTAAESSTPLTERLARLAAAAAGARARLRARVEARLGRTLEPARDPALPAAAGSPGIAVSTAAVAALPEALLPHALALLHRRAGAPYPAGAAARGELARQLAARFGTGTSTPTANGKPERIGCDCGGGWRWEESGELLVLRAADPPEPPRFSYTLRVPGEVEIPELGLRMRVRSAPVTGWMFRGSAWRAALALPFGLRGVDPATGTGDRAPALTVRTRRPGDRIHPLGAPGSRKLKDLLIDRRIPRSRRDRIPLLCLGDRIAWVPGVTVDEAFRVPPGAERTWIAEVVP